MIKPPKNHRIWVQYPIKDDIYIITSTINDRTKYYLYKQNGKEWDKIAQSNNPLKLEEKVLKNNGK